MESRGEDIKAMVKRLGSVFLSHRELSAQEAVYRILSLALKMLSRKVVFINTSPKEDRVSLLKPAKQLESMADESEDIFQTSLIDRYAARPDSLNICLAQFAANYTTRSGTEPEETYSLYPNQKTQGSVHAFSSRMGLDTCTSVPGKQSSASTDLTRRRKPTSCTDPS